MRWLIGLAFVGVMVGGSRYTAGNDQPSPRTRLHFRLSIYEGDPLGSREAGTLKVLAEPILVTEENQSCSFNSGGEVPVGADGQVQYLPFGRMIKAKPGSVKDGKIPIDITLSNT